MAKYGILIIAVLFVVTSASLITGNYLLAGLSFVTLISFMLATLYVLSNIFELQKAINERKIAKKSLRYNREIMWIKVRNIYPHISDGQIMDFNNQMYATIKLNPDHKENIIFDLMDEAFPEIGYKDFSRIYTLIVNNLETSTVYQNNIDACEANIDQLENLFIFKFIDPPKESDM